VGDEGNTDRRGRLTGANKGRMHKDLPIASSGILHLIHLAYAVLEVLPPPLSLTRPFAGRNILRQ